MEKIITANGRAFLKNLGGSKRILFANAPADGHFNPLTGIAKYLQSAGHDVRWYTSKEYSGKLARLGIPHYRYKIAKEATGSNIEEVFPERGKIRNKISKLNFDLINFFVLRGPEYYADMEDIYQEFPFDLLIADCAFTGLPFVTDKMDIPAIAIGVMPLTESSKDLAPAGLGMTPAKTRVGKLKHAMLRWLADRLLFSKSNKVMRQLLDSYQIFHGNLGIFDLLVKKSTFFLQSGTPGFEYDRSDLGGNIRYIGPLLPWSQDKEREPWFDDRIISYKKIVLVTQGTVEKDIEKILVPTLEAFRKTSVLVIATTGGSQTGELRARFPERNFIIEDFIPFEDVMPYAGVYVTNGGYGGVILGIQHNLPMVVAGIHEGKNEINARIGYFNLGIDLKTESPSPTKIYNAVQDVFAQDIYRENVAKLADEFSYYEPNQLVAEYVAELLDEVKWSLSPSMKTAMAI